MADLAQTFSLSLGGEATMDETSRDTRGDIRGVCGSTWLHRPEDNRSAIRAALFQSFFDGGKQGVAGFRVVVSIAR